MPYQRAMVAPVATKHNFKLSEFQIFFLQFQCKHKVKMLKKKKKQKAEMLATMMWVVTRGLLVLVSAEV